MIYLNLSAKKIIEEFLRNIPSFTPEEMLKHLNHLGYRGQERAKRSVILFAYRHVKRLKLLFLKNVPETSLPPKENILLIGPTGCGKTYLIELLFQHILNFPTTFVDITNYSETGYVGDDPVTIFTRLILEAKGNIPLASIGIVFLDEFDKLSSSQNTAVFSGQGTTKDVSGFGVQKELLKMLENSVINVPTEISHSSYAKRFPFPTVNVAFIAAGAFSNIKNVLKAMETNKLGFNKTESANKKTTEIDAYKLLNSTQINIINFFQKYGFLPELIARFPKIVVFDKLDRETMKQILIDNFYKKYVLELKFEGIKLTLTPKAINAILDQVKNLDIGARGLRNVLLNEMEAVLFEIYSRPKKYKEIIITAEADELKTILL